MSIGRCDWLLQEGQWICGFLFTYSFLFSHFAVRHNLMHFLYFSVLLSVFPSFLISLFSPNIYVCLSISRSYYLVTYCCHLFAVNLTTLPEVASETFCPLLYAFSTAFFLYFLLFPCFSGRWINATEVVPAQSSFTAGKTKQKKRKRRNSDRTQKRVFPETYNIYAFGEWFEINTLDDHVRFDSFLMCLCHSYSDGTGRAGTYILIDMVLNRMAKGELLIQTRII